MNTHAARALLKYRKTDAARWLSHLDLTRILERAIRRAKLPVAYSEGFNPRLRMSFGPPLPLGASSDAELLLLRLVEPVGSSQIKERLSRQLPAGIEMEEVRGLGDNEPGLPAIGGASYLVRAVCRADNPADAARQAIAEFLARKSVIIERMDKNGPRRVDIRPGIDSIELVVADRDIITMRIQISHLGERIPKPIEALQALCGQEREFEVVSIHRESFY